MSSKDHNRSVESKEMMINIILESISCELSCAEVVIFFFLGFSERGVAVSQCALREGGAARDWWQHADWRLTELHMQSAALVNFNFL